MDFIQLIQLIQLFVGRILLPQRLEAVNAAALLDSLHHHGIILTVVDGNIRYEPTPDPATLEEMRQHKAELLLLLAALPEALEVAHEIPDPPAPANSPIEDRHYQEIPDPSADDPNEIITERAAILEHDAGLPQDQAEQKAVDTAGPCRSCHSSRFWVSKYGPIVCGACHPPADERVVIRWVDASTGEA